MMAWGTDVAASPTSDSCPTWRDEADEVVAMRAARKMAPGHPGLTGFGAQHNFAMAPPPATPEQRLQTFEAVVREQ